MRALTVTPGKPGSLSLADVPEPPREDGSILVRTLAIGICGTDHEIAAGHYGSAPAGEARLIIGHESLGRVINAPHESGFAPGDLVVGIVRRPDPVPCAACAIDEWDMCRNGRYTERGIKERHGYASERFRIEPDFLVKIDPSLGRLGVLLEPASVVAKAWEQIERIGARAHWQPQTVLVTGAGPIGLLAALLGAERGLDVHVFDRATEGPKPQLVHALGATYHSGTIAELNRAIDVAIECTGAASVVLDVASHVGPAGIVCLAGISAGGHTLEVDIGEVNRRMVLGNGVMFGSVNANRRHYEAAAAALLGTDPNWLDALISRRQPLDDWQDALARRPDDIKVVLDFAA